MGAERDVSRCFAGRHSDLGLEPLSKRVDQTHQCDRRLADLGRQGDEIVEGLFGLRIENRVLLQGLKALRFILW